MKGYHPYEITLPTMDDPTYFDAVRRVSETLRALKPWTLVAMPGELYAPLVATKRNVWWILRTWWHNIWRRRKAERQRVAMAHYFAPEQVAARAVANTSTH